MTKIEETEIDRLLADAGFSQTKHEQYCEIGDIVCKHFQKKKCFANGVSSDIDDCIECPCMDKQEEVEYENDDDMWSEDELKAYSDLCNKPLTSVE